MFSKIKTMKSTEVYSEKINKLKEERHPHRRRSGDVHLGGPDL